MKPCLDCGTPTQASRCPRCQEPLTRADNARRHAKQRQHGRTTAGWQKVREAVIARDRGRCRHCGKPGRSVHLDPRLQGRHDLATAADCVLLCDVCHGKIDGRRSRS